MVEFPDICCWIWEDDANAFAALAMSWAVELTVVVPDEVWSDPYVKGTFEVTTRLIVLCWLLVKIFAPPPVLVRFIATGCCDAVVKIWYRFIVGKGTF